MPQLTVHIVDAGQVYRHNAGTAEGLEDVHGTAVARKIVATLAHEQVRVQETPHEIALHLRLPVPAKSGV